MPHSITAVHHYHYRFQLHITSHPEVSLTIKKTATNRLKTEDEAFDGMSTYFIPKEKGSSHEQLQAQNTSLFSQAPSEAGCPDPSSASEPTEAPNRSIQGAQCLGQAPIQGCLLVKPGGRHPRPSLPPTSFHTAIASKPMPQTRGS